MMDDLYTSYLKAFKRGIPVIPAGEGTFYVPSYSNPKERHLVTYNGEGMPLCTCKAGGRCWHGAAVVSFVNPAQQRAWDERRTYEANRRALLIRQGKVNPKRYPRIRAAMNDIEKKFPRVERTPICSRCFADVPAGPELCAPCKEFLDSIWPGSPEFARELEREDHDEHMRLELGMGE